MKNRILLFAGWALMLTGCHALGDPSCDVHREIRDTHFRDCLYAPNLDLAKVTRTASYRCAPVWSPACGPLFHFQGPARHLPTADAIIALPDSVRPSSD